LLIDSGWLSARRFLVPADRVYARGDGDDLYVNLRKTDVEALPEFRDDALLSDSTFATYESDYRHNWRSDIDPGRLRASGRLEKFRNSIYHVVARDRRLEKRSVNSADIPASYVATGGLHPTGVYGVYTDREQVEKGSRPEQGIRLGKEYKGPGRRNGRRRHRSSGRRNTRLAGRNRLARNSGCGSFAGGWTYRRRARGSGCGRGDRRHNRRFDWSGSARDRSQTL
jgi:hypothetical protein